MTFQDMNLQQEQINKVLSFIETQQPQKRIKLYDAISQIITTYSKLYKRSWKRDVQLFNTIKKWVDNVYIDKLTGADIRKFVSFLKLKGYANGTINRHLSFLRMVLNKIKEDGYKVKNIKFKMLREENKTLFFSDREVSIILKNTKGYLKDFVFIALNTGMRKQEILNLKWDDVDLDNKIIKIKQTKTGVEQTVYINNTLFDYLMELKTRTNVYLVERSGVKLNNIKTGFKAFLQRQGIYKKGYCIHTLRHTFASKLVSKGVNIITLKELLRHQNINTTMRYAHLNCTHLKNQVEKLNFKADRK